MRVRGRRFKELDEPLLPFAANVHAVRHHEWLLPNLAPRYAIGSISGSVRTNLARQRNVGRLFVDRTRKKRSPFGKQWKSARMSKILVDLTRPVPSP
jgi:hypothetical protein